MYSEHSLMAGSTCPLQASTPPAAAAAAGDKSPTVKRMSSLAHYMMARNPDAEEEEKV